MLRDCTITLTLVSLFAAGPWAAAQETRGTIHGRVVDPQSRAVAGAVVTVINTDTNTAARLTTNETGYYEANLLLPGSYQVSVDAAGFKRYMRDGIVLPLATRLEIGAALEVGNVTESISVTAVAPMLDTSTASSGRVMDTRTLLDLPTPSNNAMQLVRQTPGVQSGGNLNYNPQHAWGTVDFYLPGKVGGPEYSVDGAPNNGRERYAAYQPTADTLQEMKVETSNFDAAVGHTTGFTVNMMTKFGTNQIHGTANWTHWQKRWTGTEFFVRKLYYTNIARAEAAGNQALADQLRGQPKQQAGNYNSYAATVGGPIVIPKLIDGRNKLFFFFGTDGYRSIQPQWGSMLNTTLPTLANREGDFSQLLQVDAVRYQIYDPVSVRADPARPTHYVRQPFPGNVLPKSRFNNPTYNSYVKFLPTPNSDPSNPRLEPLNNYLAVGMNFIWDYDALNNRIDYHYSEKHRFFGRWNWADFKEDSYDWTYSTYRHLQSGGLTRRSYGVTVDHVYTHSATTLLDIAASVNQYTDGFLPSILASVKFKPSDVGLPKYMDDKAGDLHILPDMNFTGYTPIGPNPQRTGYPTLVNYRLGTGKATLTHVRGHHSITAGADARQHFRTGGGGGATSGTFTFSNAYTRRNDDSFTPAGDLGHSWAAYVLGIPNGMSIASSDTYVISNPYFGWFAQDNWRVTPELSLNVGLRLEYEMGPLERFNRAITNFDPGAALPITQGAQAAYARSPIPELAASQFLVRGGSLFAGQGGDRLWRNELMWMPRVAAAYQWDRNTVLRGGYGIFFDTNNVLMFSPDQSGYSRSTSTVVTNDFGMTWRAGDPARGISPLTDPFPVRADGTRFDTPTRDGLGLMARAGRNWSYRDDDFRHTRLQRWRFGAQRQITANMMAEAAYGGSYGDRMPISQTLSALPEQYWADGLVRNDALASNMNANVPNPFLIGNFADLRTSNPLLYQDLTTQGFFTSPTIRKHQLLRPFPQMNGLTRLNTKAGKLVSHEINLSATRRFSKGFQFDASYTRLWIRNADLFLQEFDPEPFYRPAYNGRPHRIVANGIVELPFGKGKPLASRGVAGALLGGFKLALTWDYQPGNLLPWGNMFFYGNIEDIGKGERTLDRWFNTDGFERLAARGPVGYHKRVFPPVLEGLRADSLNIWNSNLQRSFRIKEGVSLQLRFDALNMFNRSTFNAPNMSPYSTDFGRVTGSSTTVAKRWLQVQARLKF